MSGTSRPCSESSLNCLRISLSPLLLSRSGQRLGWRPLLLGNRQPNHGGRRMFLLAMHAKIAINLLQLGGGGVSRYAIQGEHRATLGASPHERNIGIVNHGCVYESWHGCKFPTVCRPLTRSMEINSTTVMITITAIASIASFHPPDETQR